MGDERVIQRAATASRRFAAAERERHAALTDLTAACAELTDGDLVALTRDVGLPVATLIAIRVRLGTQRLPLL